MKQEKIIIAYSVLETLGTENKLPMRVARQIFDLRKALAPTWEFWEGERRRLFDKYGKTDPDTGNSVITRENMQKFLAEKKELDDLDVVIPGLPVRIDWPDDVNILPAHMWALDDMADFGGA